MYTTSDKFHSFGESEWTTVFDANNRTKTSKLKTNALKRQTKNNTNDSCLLENENDENPIDIKNKNDFACGKCLITIKK